MDAEPTRPERVAAVQMCSGADPGENLASAARLLRVAAARGASVALLPENFSLMARRDADRRAHAEADGSGPVQEFLARTARELKLWIVAGSVPIAGGADGRLAQSCLVYGADGARKARYDKIHLFDVDLPDRHESYPESAHMAPVDATPVIDTPAGRRRLRAAPVSPRSRTAARGCSSMSEAAMQLAQAGLLAPAGLDPGRLGKALDLVLGAQVDAADLYFQVSHEESWALEDGIVKEGSASIGQGVGVRALAGERTGFAYSDEIQPLALEEAARAARAIAVRGGSGAVQAWRRVNGHQLYQPVDPLLSLADDQKVAWLERVDRETRRMDPRIVRVMASVHAVHEVILVATSDGTLAADVRPLVRMNVSVIAEHNCRREHGYAGAGGRFTLAELGSKDRPLELAREAVRQALVNLEAVNAPAGTMTGVLRPGWPRIPLHQAIGA